MRVAEIEIMNFKGIRHETFQPDSFACLVGENNAGKSTVLQALVYSLNRPPRMPITLHYDQAAPVEFRVDFTEISEADLNRLEVGHRNKVAPLLHEDSLTLIIRYPPDDKADLKVAQWLPRDERLRDQGLSELFKGARGTAVRDIVKREFPELLDGLPEGANATQAKEYLASHVAGLPRDALIRGEVPLPSGIPTSISNLLPEPIYIPAVKDLSDETKTTQATSFGRLIGLLIDDLKPDLEDFDQALQKLDRMLNVRTDGGKEEDNRHEKVQELERRVEDYLARHFHQAHVRLVIPPPELKTVLNAAQIWVDDGALDLIENKGDGIRRSLTFALLRAYVDRLVGTRRGANDEIASRPLMFLFEEPELFLHPKSQRLLFRMLENISKDHQVVVTTHSPIFFAPGVTASFVRVTKQSSEPKPIGVLNEVRFSLDPSSAETFRLVRFENTDAAFFSSKVILFEGESDDHFLRHVARKLDPEWDFERESVAFLKVGGKGNFKSYRTFFERFGIEVLTLADLDALFEGFQHLGASTDTAKLRQEAIARIDARVGELGHRPELTGRRIKKKVRQNKWTERYESVRALVEQFRASGEIPDGLVTGLDELFAWEQDDSRMQVVQSDEQAFAEIVPVIDALRCDGVAVLARGAIEDYYPPEIASIDSKPERALLACGAVTDRTEALALSKPLAPGRLPELEEVLTWMFHGAEEEKPTSNASARAP